MTTRKRKWFGACFFALMLGHFAVNAYSSWQDLTRKIGSSDGWTARVGPKGPKGPKDLAQIVSVDPKGPAATALQVGDEFVSINGLSLQDDPKILNYNQRVPPGNNYTMIVRRQGQLREFSLTTINYPISRRLLPIADTLVQLLFILTGLIVFLLKPSDRQAWLLALMLGSFTGLFNNQLPPLPFAALLMMALARIIGLWFIPVFCNFFLIFPDRSPLLRKFPNIERRLYWPFYLILPWFAFGRLLVIFRSHEILGQSIEKSWLLRQQWIGLISLVVLLTYLIAGLAALFLSYRVAGVAARRKLHVIVAGGGAGFTNLLALIVWETFFQERFPEAGNIMGVGLKFTLPLIPLSFAYAIVRHQVIPVSLIIRRSVRYVLVLHGAILLDMIAVGLSVTAVLTYIFKRTKPPGIVIGLVSAAVSIVTWKVASSLHDKYLRPLIDRRFFRQSYDAQQIIADLTGSLRTVTDLPQLLELVATKIQTALQPNNVTIFLRDSLTGNFNCAFSRDYSEIDGQLIDHSRRPQLTKAAALVGQGSDNSQAVELDSAGNPEGLEGGGISAADREALQEVSATLLMPLASKNELLGFITLGPRLGDLPFSREDKGLLMSVSGPAGFAIENARLVEQMVEDARRSQQIEVDHRRKTEELAFARQLQLSMLPKRNFSLGQIEIIGQMRTASEVGGDYYDFIEMADGRVCMAVGDATGHGMAAGLVVGMVKMGLIHSLQGEATRANGHASVKPLVEQLNQSLKRSLSQRGMGMCLGAAILSPATLKVEVISNGMPAPYHYRAATRELTSIATQSPPLGFLRQINVRPVEFQLGEGDALVWLSDGFEERLNAANQVWGDEQVERALKMICDEGPSAENIARLMIDACDDAAEGRNNDDDMTIVVAKIKAGIA